VQPDLEQLDLNMEDNEGIQETKEDMKLGKLQFSLDYDFQKGEVDDDNLTPLVPSVPKLERYKKLDVKNAIQYSNENVSFQ